MLRSIKLDGRTFHPISQALTANQDDYILAYARLSGAVEILNGIDGKERTDEQRAEDMLTRMYLSGHTYHILAGMLTEDGKVWSRESAEANAKRFAAITNADEKSAMRTSIVEFVIGFFSLGAPSSETSPKSSSPSATVPPTKTAARKTSATSHR